MFEIFDDQVTAYSVPHKNHIARITKKKGTLKKISLSATVGEDWSVYADSLKDAGIDELEVFVDGSKQNYAWLKKFCSFRKLYIHSSTLPEAEDFQLFKNLVEIGLGADSVAPINDLSKIECLLKNIKSVTLIGKWKKCSLLSLYGISELHLSCFRSSEELFLRGSGIKSLVIHSSDHFSFENIKLAKSLEKLELLSKVDSSNLPDLSENKSLKEVFVENEKNLVDFQKTLPSLIKLELL